MMVGPLEGRYLQMLVFALKPRLVLEIGTFSGYSSLSMAAGLPHRGPDHLVRAQPGARRDGPSPHRVQPRIATSSR